MHSCFQRKNINAPTIQECPVLLRKGELGDDIVFLPSPKKTARLPLTAGESGAAGYTDLQLVSIWANKCRNTHDTPLPRLTKRVQLNP